jgi:hypothetical protein
LASCPSSGAPPSGGPPPLDEPSLPSDGPLLGFLLRPMFIAVAMHCFGVCVVMVAIVAVCTMMVGAVCIIVDMAIKGMGIFMLIRLCQISLVSFFASLSCSLVKSLLDDNAVLLISDSAFCLPLG